MTPASPDGVDVHAFGNIDDQLDVGIIVIVCATRNLEDGVNGVFARGFGDALAAYLDVLVGHSDVISVCLQIFWGGHDGELNGTFVAKGLVGPFPH